MRNALLVVSLVANALLIAVLVRKPRDVVVERERWSTNTTVITQRMEWSSLESSDYPVYIKNLRAIHCPEQTVRDIIITDVDALFAPKVTGLKSGFKYWRPAQPWTTRSTDLERLRKLRQIYDEKRSLIWTLLSYDIGPMPLSEWQGTEADASVFDFLPADKRFHVRTIRERFLGAQEEVLRRTRGAIWPIDVQTMKQAQAQLEADLAAVLTPTEMHEYNLRFSQAASQVRSQLAWFDATDKEFEALVALQQKFDSKYNYWERNSLTTDRQFQEQMEKDRIALHSEVGSALGAERAAQYFRAQDSDYQATAVFAERFSLPSATSDQLLALRNSTVDGVQAIASNNALDPATKARQLDDLRSAVQGKLAQLLPKDTLDAYYLSQGKWLKRAFPGSP